MNPYPYAEIAVFVISVLSLLGVLLVPCINSVGYDDMMSAFIGLAVGSLASDALLHLVPQVITCLVDRQTGIHVHVSFNQIITIIRMYM